MTEIIAESLEIAIPYEDDSSYEIGEDLKTKLSKIHKAMGRWAARFRRPANPRRGVVRRVAHARARRTAPSTAARATDSGGKDPDPEPRRSSQATIAYQDASYRLESKQVHRTRAGLRVTSLTLVSDSKSTTQTSVSYPAYSQPLDLQGKHDGVISHMGVPITLMTPLTPRAPLGTRRAPLLVGLDAEWQATDGTRRILSVQLSCRCHDGKERVWILWHPGQTRFEFGTVLGWFLSDLAPYIGYKDYVPKEDSDPYHITLAGHYAIVDLTVAYDRKKILRKTDSLRRTLASVEKPMYQTVWSEDRNRCRPVVLSVRDTMLLAPAGSSVERLGEALKYPKLTLPDGHDKGEMERLRREEPAAFVCYAARDAEISRRWIEQMVGSNVYVPVTLGGQAATLLRDAIMTARGWSQPDFDFQWRGLATTAESYADDTGKMRRRKVIVPRPEAALLLTAAGHAYLGGRNEGFLYGIHHASAGSGWSDFDLAGAYPTAMCLVGDPDYSAPPTVLTGRLGRDMLKPNSWLFGHVRFRFPAGTMYPCLPVKDPFGRGLIFPLEGETWASAPELWLALKAGCEVDLTQPAFLLPTGQYSLREGMRGLVQARAEAEAMYGKKSAQALAAKERANSAYGKLAQGLAGKRAFSTRHAATQAIPPSPITSAPQAALTTGLVRAVVSAAMMQLHEHGYRIASVTTDGFLTDASLEVLAGLDLYGLREGFEAARRGLVGSDTIWELKHRARTLVMLKTRGGFGIGPIDEHALPSAGAGYKVSGAAVKERVEQVGKPAALAELFLNRVGRIGFGFHALPSPRDYVLHGADGVGKEVTKEISWEWDYKRDPVPGSDRMETVTIDGTQYAHVSYDTRPWVTIDAFSNARAATDGLSDAVKTTDDVAEVHKRIARRPAAKKARVRVRGNLARAEAVTVLRGLRSGILNADWFDRETVTGREVCERVGLVFGVALGRDDWKNAGRADRSRKVLFVGLAGELAKLGIVINPNPNP